MGTSHSGHKHDASEGNKILDWDSITVSDLAYLKKDMPESICPTCKYFDTHPESGSWEDGELDFVAWDCYAKDEEGEDLHYDNVIDDYFTTECPYFVKKEQP